MVCPCVYGVPFGSVPAGLFRYGVRFVMAEGFRCGKRPNGMAVGFSVSCWRHDISVTPYKRNEVECSVGWRRGFGNQRAEGTQLLISRCQ